VTKHIVHAYDKELASLSDSIVNMGKLVKDLLIIANQSLQELGTDYYEVARSTDAKINEYDLLIERQAITILALRQPMAIDLRYAVSALKLAVIMERMGDLAKNTSKRAAELTISLTDEIRNNIQKMSKIIEEMVEAALEAFKKNDTEQARIAALRDDEVDEIYYALLNKLSASTSESPLHAPDYLQVIFAIKNLERIGDYVAKFAQIINYIVTGERQIKDLKTDKN
jgi:phosphate transport system protein